MLDPNVARTSLKEYKTDTGQSAALDFRNADLKLEGKLQLPLKFLIRTIGCTPIKAIELRVSKRWRC
jgi:hypothetical protein